MVQFFFIVFILGTKSQSCERAFKQTLKCLVKNFPRRDKHTPSPDSFLDAKHSLFARSLPPPSLQPVKGRFQFKISDAAGKNLETLQGVLSTGGKRAAEAEENLCRSKIIKVNYTFQINLNIWPRNFRLHNPGAMKVIRQKAAFSDYWIMVVKLMSSKTCPFYHSMDNGQVSKIN